MPGDHKDKKKKQVKDIRERLAKINKKVPQDKIRETPTKENNYQTHMDSKGEFEQRALKEKVKKAELTDRTKEHKQKQKKKDKLIHEARGLGVAPNYNNPSKVKKKVPQGPNPNAETADDILKNAEIASRKNDTYIAQLKQKIAEKRKKDYQKIEAEEKEEVDEARKHKHLIEFRGHTGQYYKRASLVSSEGRYAKYWLLNAKQTNGNGWGVSQQSIAKNINKFIGRPLVVTAKSWVPESEYGDQFEHPYLPTNDINKVLDHQEKFRIGSIVDIIEKDGDYYANIEINQKFANMILPPFCSPAIFQNNPAEPEGQISDWEALHLAALMEDPAYGSRIALLRGTCIGTKDQCSVQFKSAKKEAKMVCTKGTRERLAGINKKEKDWADRPYRGTDWDVGGTPEDYQIDPKTGKSTYEPEFDEDGNEIDYGRPDDRKYEEETKKKSKTSKLKKRLAKVRLAYDPPEAQEPYNPLEESLQEHLESNIANKDKSATKKNRSNYRKVISSEEKAIKDNKVSKPRRMVLRDDRNPTYDLEEPTLESVHYNKMKRWAKMKKNKKTSDQAIDDVIKDIKDPALKEDAIKRLDKPSVGPKNYSPSLKDKKKLSKLKQRLALTGTMPKKTQIDKYGRVISNEPQTFQQQSTKARLRIHPVEAYAEHFEKGPTGRKQVSWDKLIEERTVPRPQEFSNMFPEQAQQEYYRQHKNKNKLGDITQPRLKIVDKTHDPKFHKKKTSSITIRGGGGDPYGRRPDTIQAVEKVREKQPPTVNMFQTKAPQDIQKSRFPPGLTNKYSKLKQKLGNLQKIAWKWKKNPDTGRWEKVNLDYDEIVGNAKKEKQDKFDHDKMIEAEELEKQKRGTSPWQNYDKMIEDGLSNDEALANSGLSHDTVRDLADNPEQLWEYGVSTPNDLKKNPEHKGYKKVYRGPITEVNKKGDISQRQPEHRKKLIERPPIDNTNEVKDDRFDDKGDYIPKRKRGDSTDPDDPNYRVSKLKQKLGNLSSFPNPKNSFTIRLKKGLTDIGWEPRYVNYAIQNQINQGWAKKYQSGTAQQFIRKNDLNTMDIYDANTGVNMKLGEIADVLPGTVEPRSGDTIFQRTGSPGKTQYFE